MLLAARSVSVRVGREEILPATSLVVGRGEVVAVLGPSGAGKTTLLACLGGLRRPSTGSVTVLGREMTLMRSARRARFRLTTVGLVYQHADLLPELTPVQNVMLPALLAGSDPSDVRRDAERLIAELGVRTSAGTALLSGGEAQRLALARALITSPSVLLADEPTGSLDASNRDDVLASLCSRVRSNGMGAVVVTHDPVVAAAADRTVALRATAPTA